MYACVTFTHFNAKKIIPLQWIYAEIVDKKQHYISYYHTKIWKTAPPQENLIMGANDDMQPKHGYKIYLHKFIGKQYY